MAESMKDTFGIELLNIFDEEHAHGKLAFHGQLIRDKERVNAFRLAIQKNHLYFKGKVVLEIACGTGLLSMLAAQAGASKVYALDASCLANCASQFIHDNNLDAKITCIRGKIDEIELPDNVNEVDIIIADWSSHCLHYRNLLKKVLRARNKWLVQGGIIFPSHFYLFVQGINNGQYKENHVDWWNNVYGFDMSPIAEAIKAKGEGINYWTHKKQLMTNSCLVQEINMYTAQPDDDIMSGSFRLNSWRNDHVNAIIVYFQAEFKNLPYRFGYSTGPSVGLNSFYGQIMLSLDDYIPVRISDRIEGKLEIETGCCLYKDTMDGLDLHLSLNRKNESGETYVVKKQYCLNKV